MTAAPAKTVLVTGASSGLGEALAVAYAEPGCRLVLFARDAARLEAVVAKARARGAVADGHIVDVTDSKAMALAIETLDVVPDIVFANAGVSAGTGALSGETEDQTRRIFAVNVDGVINTVVPALTGMRKRGGGQIVIVSSLAGFRGLPTAPAYSASKAAVRVWGEGLRRWLKPQGIGVTVVCPGFVRTPMTARNRFPMPLMMEAGEAARRIRKGVDQNRARVAFPWPLVAAMILLAALPPTWTDPLLGLAPAKE